MAISTEDRPKISEDVPETTNDFPSPTENVPNSTEDFTVENGEVAVERVHNTTSNENQTEDNIENSTSEGVHPEEILSADQVNTVIDDDIVIDDDSIDNIVINDSIDDIDDISEATDSEYSKSEETEGAIKIPTVASVDSADNMNCLSSSDLCSLSSWREAKGLPSLTTVSSFLENESFSENWKDVLTASVSSSDSRESHNGHDIDRNYPPRNVYNASQGQTVDGEMDSRNSVSQTGSTTSSIRSGEPTDTDYEAFSESMSSISTTNSHERPKLASIYPKEGFGTQFEPSNGLDTQTVFERGGKSGQTEVGNVDNSTDDVFVAEDIQVNPGEVNDSPMCDDVTDAGQRFQPTENVGEQSESVGEQSESGGAPSEGVDAQLENANAKSESVGDKSGNSSEHSESAGHQLDVGLTESENIGAQSENVDEQPEGVDPEPETGATKSETVETQKCTLCKESVAVDQLVTIALDVAELIELKYLHCWRSGVCFSHPDVFLVVVYRPLSDSVVVEIAVSPNALGRRLLTFVVDHLDTLIKEWYPGLLTSCGTEPTVQKRIPCRSCEKDGNHRPHMFAFDSCVTQYSMANFVKCPEHEVRIQDIAPDVVLNDIDADLLLQEDELKYEKSNANMIGKGM